MAAPRPSTPDPRPSAPGWTWRVWGRRRHWMREDDPGRTLCGRRWHGGLTGCTDDAHRCRSCVRCLERAAQEKPDA